jgi:glucokinase
MANKKKKYILGIDLGGTKILIGLFDKKFNLKKTVKLEMDGNRGERFFFNELIDGIEEVLEETGSDLNDLLTIGVGCPGIIDIYKGIVKVSSNVSFFKNYPLAEKLKSKLKLKVPVFIENDANAGLFGEQQFGAARGYREVAGVFLGTGIGGALIINGHLYRGASGGAGEIGQTFLSLPSFSDFETSRQKVGALVGRNAIASEAGFLLLRQKCPHLLEEIGYNVKKIRSGALSRAIKAGDTALEELVRSRSRWLGVALANVVNILNPELILLGGGMMEAMGKIILPEVRRAMEAYAIKPLVKAVKIVPSKLKDYAVILGIAKMAHEVVKAAQK